MRCVLAVKVSIGSVCCGGFLLGSRGEEMRVVLRTDMLC